MSKTTAPHQRALCPNRKCFTSNNRRTSLPANDIAQQHAHMRKSHPKMNIKSEWRLVKSAPGTVQPPSRTGKRSVKMLIKDELRSGRTEPVLRHEAATPATIPEEPAVSSFRERTKEETPPSVMYPDMAL